MFDALLIVECAVHYDSTINKPFVLAFKVFWFISARKSLAFFPVQTLLDIFIVRFVFLWGGGLLCLMLTFAAPNRQSPDAPPPPTLHTNSQVHIEDGLLRLTLTFPAPNRQSPDAPPPSPSL